MKLIDNSLKSFRVAGRLPQWMVWGIAVALFFVAWSGVGIWARWSAMRELSAHTDKWSEDGVLEQETSYSCVPVSIVMLLRVAGISSTTFEVAKIAGTDIHGTAAGGIIRAGRHFGFDVERRIIGFDEFIEEGKPAIVEFRYRGIRHAALVTPVPDVGAIDVKDPVQGHLMFWKEGADDYFGSDRWVCFLFERAESLI